ncbi:MAG: DMT family transporter [Pirellulales bacterium]
MPRWISWTLLTLVSWGVWAILFRAIGDEMTPAQSQAVSTLGVLPVLVALCLMKDPAGTVNHRRGILLALASGILSCLGNIACYEALKHGKAATIVPLTALYPVVTVLLAVPILKERLSAVQWAGIGLSLSAIYLFNPTEAAAEGGGWTSQWLLLPLAAIVLWGITGLLQKAATNEVTARVTAIWFLAAFIPVGAVILMSGPLPSEADSRAWLLTILLGFTLALGNYTLMQAFACGGKASIIAALGGLYPLVSIPIALAAFHERLGWREASGVVLALVAVLLLSLQSDSPTVTPATLDTDVSI